MSDKPDVETPLEGEPRLELPEEMVAMQTELTEMRDSIIAARTKLDEEQAEFRNERARLREEIRREKVKVFLAEMDQPIDGKGLVTPVQTIVGAALLGDPVEQEGEATVQLEEDASIASVHAYYRSALEALVGAIPRTVPVGSNVEPKDVRPKDVNLNAERAKHREAMYMSKADSGIELTEEVKTEIEAALDRRYGEEG